MEEKDIIEFEKEKIELEKMVDLNKNQFANSIKLYGLGDEIKKTLNNPMKYVKIKITKTLYLYILYSKKSIKLKIVRN